MSTVECPPTPPNLPEGEAALTPPPKNEAKSDPDEPQNPGKTRRPSSPDPNCAICLGKLQNMSYTDACFHKFCFVCLLEWSKVRPVCPLCKSKFKSIIHNIKSDDDYESYTLPPPPPPTAQDAAAIVIGDDAHDVFRRFRYRTTMADSGPAVDFERFIQGFENQRDQNRRELEQLRAIAAQMYQWRTQLPTMLPPRPQRHNAGSSWSRRRGRATSEFRRDIYRRNLYVDPESISDITGRYRESSPAWYRTNPAQTHRLVPWLNRELNALLEGSEHQSAYVTQKILQFIERFEIRSPEFHEKLLPYLGNRTDHFQHEFYHYARSVYDLIGYDRAATYTENQTPHNSVMTPDQESDDDDIVVVDEVRRTRSEEPVPQQSEQPPTQLQPQSENTSSSASAISTFMDAGPSTSTGISSSAPLHRLVIPASDSSEDEQVDQQKSGEVEIVGEVKPRHERTPVIVDLSSDEVMKEAKIDSKADVMIEISSDEDEKQSSDEEIVEKRRQQMLEEIAEKAKKAKQDRYNERRYKSFIHDFKNRKKKVIDEYEADETWRAENHEELHEQPQNSEDEFQTKGKGKGKNSKNQKKKSKKRKKCSSSSDEEQPLQQHRDKKRKKSKKRKKTKETTENETKWKVTVSNSSSNQQQRRSPSLETEDLRLLLSRKRPLQRLDFSTEDTDTDEQPLKKVKSVVCIPPN